VCLIEGQPATHITATHKHREPYDRSTALHEGPCGLFEWPVSEAPLWIMNSALGQKRSNRTGQSDSLLAIRP